MLANFTHLIILIIIERSQSCLYYTVWQARNYYKPKELNEIRKEPGSTGNGTQIPSICMVLLNTRAITALVMGPKSIFVIRDRQMFPELFYYIRVNHIC